MRNLIILVCLFFFKYISKLRLKNRLVKPLGRARAFYMKLNITNRKTIRNYDDN